MRAFSRAPPPGAQKPEEEQRGESEETKPHRTHHCAGRGPGERGPACSDFRDVSEGASAWPAFPVGGRIRDSAQGRTKSEARFRQTEARVQRARGRVGARTRALCARAQGWSPGQAYDQECLQRGWGNMDASVVDAVSRSQEQSIFRGSRSGEDHEFPSWWPSLLSGEEDSQEGARPSPGAQGEGLGFLPPAGEESPWKELHTQMPPGARPVTEGRFVTDPSKREARAPSQGSVHPCYR